MKNLLNRNEYLESMNEGFIGDTAKKIGQGIKNLFKIGMKKIKDFIAIFDNNGNVLPVVSAQAVMDHFSKSDAVKVAAPKEISDAIVAAGGSAVSQTMEAYPDEPSDFGPNGAEYAEWVENKGYEDTIEYKNLMKLSQIMEEAFQADGDMLEESKEDIENRVFYTNNNINGTDKTTGVSRMESISYDEFEKKIDDYLLKKSKGEKTPTLLLFGAPGIGKSTIPNAVIDRWNENHSKRSEKMCLMCVNCANINPGDLMMPTIPTNKNVVAYLENNPDAFPEVAAKIGKLDDDKKDKLAKAITSSGQKIANEAPKAWLPCYHAIPGRHELNYVLDTAANGGLQTIDDKTTYKDEFFGDEYTVGKKHIATGGGGILLLDEFLRCKPGIFDELMNFLLTGEMNGWHLGSKWTIIACSNRPCDDSVVETVWSKWGGAAKDRWGLWFHLDADPESWAEWAKKKGCDNLILKFIFDEDAKDGAEYHRWHRLAGHEASSSDEGAKPVTPRNWERVFNAINLFKKAHNLNSMAEMSINDIQDTIKGYFDKDFRSEFISWINSHSQNVKLEDIINDPEGTIPPVGSDAHMICKDLYEQIKKRCDKELISDDEMSNVILWLGINYKDPNAVLTNIIYNLEYIFTSKGKSGVTSLLVKTGIMCMAAFPDKGDLDAIKYSLEHPDENVSEEEQQERVERLKSSYDKYVTEGSDSFDDYIESARKIILETAKKYFPWRVKGDTILYTNEDRDEDEVDSKVGDDDADLNISK